MDTLPEKVVSSSDNEEIAVYLISNINTVCEFTDEYVEMVMEN